MLLGYVIRTRNLILSRLYLVFFLLCSALLHAQLVSIGTDESLILANGSLLVVEGLELSPTSTFTLQNTQLSKQSNTTNTAAITNTSLVFVFSNPAPAYTGSVQITYTPSELGSLIADSLAISVYDASQWKRIIPSTVDASSRQVSAVLSSQAFQEITLQISTTTAAVSASSTTTTTSGSSSGSGSSGSSSSSGSGSNATTSSTTNTPTDTSSSTGTTDADGDGFTTELEVNCGTDPNDPESYPLDYDQDGLPDCIDPDDDADGVLDITELDCGYDPRNEADVPPDFDGDGLVNCIDPDDDNDGYLDSEDAFVFDASEWVDTDLDGIGNNADLDDDNDCFSDSIEIEAGTDALDAFDYPADRDRDCIPDTTDLDSDNDGIPDTTLVLPEIFSPNGDGINDQLVIKNIQYFPNNRVYIFSRSGLELVQIRNYNNSWNGTYRGEAVPPGSYLIAIDKDGDGKMDLNGWIYLTR